MSDIVNIVETNDMIQATVTLSGHEIVVSRTMGSWVITFAPRLTRLGTDLPALVGAATVMGMDAIDTYLEGQP